MKQAKKDKRGGSFGIVDRNGNPISANDDTNYFGASFKAKEFAHWLPNLPSADSAIQDEKDTLNARAQDLVRNNPLASGAIRTKTDNIIGTGLRLNAEPDYQALGQSPEWAAEWAETVESLWSGFSSSEQFDAAGQMNFHAATTLVARSFFIKGEFLAVPMWRPNRKRTQWATCIQLVDPDRLSNPEGRPETMYMRQGISINRYGEPTKYHIRRAHPGDYFINYNNNQFKWTTIPAYTRSGRRRVIHGFEADREDQHRGVTVLASTIAAFRMLDHYQRTELQTAVVNSMIAAFIETPLGDQAIAEMFGGDAQEYVNARKEHEVKLDGSAVIPLYPGDQVHDYTPNRPGGTYQPFVEAVLRHIATGLNLPYELLLKDFSKTNYSSARAALLESWRYFTGIREVFVQRWCKQVYDLWLEEAIDKGLVSVPTNYQDDREAYLKATWIAPGRGWIDPNKEAQASRERMESNLTTLARECAEQGMNWQEVLLQQKREKELREEYGLSKSEEEIREELTAEMAASSGEDESGGEDTDSEEEGSEDDNT